MSDYSSKVSASRARFDETHYWWATPDAYVLVNGGFSFTIPLTGNHWSASTDTLPTTLRTLQRREPAPSPFLSLRTITTNSHACSPNVGNEICSTCRGKNVRLRQAYIRVGETCVLVPMRSEQSTVYHILRVLSWGDFFWRR